MPNPPRKIAFITAATDQGTLILNRFDHNNTGGNGHYGVGLQLLETASYDASEVELALMMLTLRRQHHGDGVVAADCGANVGVHTVAWARHMTGWGVVVAIEAQERIYYALAGNIAINNCFNARAIHAALASAPGSMKMPSPNYLVPGSFGSLELRKRPDTESIGQPIDYSEGRMVDVRTVSLDAFGFPRLDLIKMDVEGMELEALAGGVRCISEKRPIMLIEKLKTDEAKLRALLDGLDYAVFDTGNNLLALHKADPCLANIQPGQPAVPLAAASA